MDTFAQIKNHFKSNHPLETSLFTTLTRTDNLKSLYEEASKIHNNVLHQFETLDSNGNSELFICTPILGQTRKRQKSNIDVDIETGLVSFTKSSA